MDGMLEAASSSVEMERGDLCHCHWTTRTRCEASASSFLTRERDWRRNFSDALLVRKT